ncbi:single-stranded DNA-binding protein [Lewinella sp. IMCC34183]|uniref:single-stranded DNA-binding protein n=1 Tax=Lewinella sp. IMCC34183 TaxID=2248762 RepID=UPI000E289CE1|nr:single-stranded DNA-binding protein [Lewinella sp. IMCC34183]
MINKVTLVGRLGADPEIRTLSNGAMVAKFSLATSENYKDRAGEWQEDTQWHDVILWRNLAERAQQYLRKGSLVYLDGKLTHRKWQDKEGNPRKTTEVVASYFRLLDGKRDGDDSGSNPAPAETGAPASPGANKTDGDDLPF